MPKTKTTKAKAKAPRPYPKPRSRVSKVVSAPVATSRTVSSRTPVFERRQNSVIIRHSEFFAPVGTPGGTAGQFWVTTYAINPGNTAVFPWLSTQAFAWERYRFKKLQIRYVPRVPTSQAGSLILSPDYDADDDAPTNELVACSYADAVSAMPWSEVVLRLNSEAMLGGMKSKYIRVGALKEGNDIKMYDALNLFVCRDSANSTPVVWGKLWIEYEVELITPHTIPIPLTSTYSGLSASALSPTHPVPVQQNATMVLTATVDKAGPISVKDNGDYDELAASGWVVEGLQAGARYLVQMLGKATGAVPATYSFSDPIMTGATLVKSLTGSHTYTAQTAGRVMTANDLIVQATDTIMTLKTAWSSAASYVSGAQLIVSPIISDAAFTLL